MSDDDQYQTFMEFLAKACKKFSPDLKIMQLFSMLKHIFGQSFFSQNFSFFPLSHAKFLAKGRECDSIVNPTFVLIRVISIVSRIISCFTIASYNYFLQIS